MPLSEIVLILMGVLFAAMVTSLLCRRIPAIPFTVMLMVVGIVCGFLADNFTLFSKLQNFSLTPELILFLFLPGLIFEAAFNMDARQLVKDIAPIITLAIPALFISTFFIGIGLWFSIEMQILLALLFGALISATDPVAVIALFKELGVPSRLTVMVEGESLLNDATAIMLFHIILGLVISGDLVDAGLLGIAAIEFMYVFLGGIFVGVAIGIPVSFALFTPSAGVSIYLIMSIVVAYSSFAIAEHLLHVSGVMAVLASGISLSALGATRIPQQATDMVKESWESIALVCNSLLFIFIGMTVDFANLINYGAAIFWAILFVLSVRAICIYPLVPAAVRLFKLPQITLPEQHIMWWGGLKGGLALAMALSIPDSLPEKDMLLAMTIGVVLFTMLVNATTIRSLIHLLGIDKLSEHETVELKYGLVVAEKEAGSLLSELGNLGMLRRPILSKVSSSLEKSFEFTADANDEELEQRQLFLQPLRMEFDELKYLLDVGLLHHYTYLDMRITLIKDREAWMSNPGKFHYNEGNSEGIFRRLEKALLSRLRESDWGTRMLARYQHLRLSQSMQRDIAGVLIYTHILEYIENQPAMKRGPKKYLSNVYRKRIDVRKERLAQVARDFPEFYQRFENVFFSRIAYASSHYRSTKALHHGEIGPRAFVEIERRINKIMQSLPGIATTPPALIIEDFINAVPLLHGLSEDVLHQLANISNEVNFLAGDIIIGQGERGDALYILLRGKVIVYMEAEDSPIATMEDGEFFGEMALLGDQVRTANIKAVNSSRLIRINRRRLLQLADQQEELMQRLEEANKKKTNRTGK